jgi:hypothetical protein
MLPNMPQLKARLLLRLPGGRDKMLPPTLPELKETSPPSDIESAEVLMGADTPPSFPPRHQRRRQSLPGKNFLIFKHSFYIIMKEMLLL